MKIMYQIQKYSLYDWISREKYCILAKMILILSNDNQSST